MLGGTDLLAYEVGVGEHSAIQCGFGYGGFKIGSFKYNSYGLGLQYRFYFREAIRGFYSNIGAAYLFGTTTIENWDIDGNDLELKFSSPSGFLGIGHQWAWDSGFVLVLNLKGSYSNFSYTWPDDIDEDDNLALRASGILPRFTLAIGYAFGDNGGRGRSKRR